MRLEIAIEETVGQVHHRRQILTGTARECLPDGLMFCKRL